MAKRESQCIAIASEALSGVQASISRDASRREERIMPRQCSICNHAKVDALNQALRSKESFRSIAKRFGTSASAVLRHSKGNHLLEPEELCGEIREKGLHPKPIGSAQESAQPVHASSRVMGRPKIEISVEVIEKLAAMQCSPDEIAAFCGVSDDTIRRRLNEPEFAAALQRGRAQGRQGLRRMQFESAQRGNTAMQIWLGKQLLGQKDKLETDNTNRDAPTADVVKEMCRKMPAGELRKLVDPDEEAADNRADWKGTLQ